MNTIIAIDPGKNGGIVLRDGNGEAAYKMPETCKDLSELICEIWEGAKLNKNAIVCYMEKVGTMAHDGHMQAFSFGKNIGHLEQCLIDYGIRTIEVTPQKWQKALALGSSKNHSSKAAWKNHLKAMAQRLFPQTKVTLWNADALLISEYAWQQEK